MGAKHTKHISHISHISLYGIAFQSFVCDISRLLHCHRHHRRGRRHTKSILVPSPPPPPPCKFIAFVRCPVAAVAFYWCFGVCALDIAHKYIANAKRDVVGRVSLTTAEQAFNIQTHKHVSHRLHRCRVANVPPSYVTRVMCVQCELTA